jgi:hypothetical protein
MELLILAALLGLLPAYVASSKGYSFATWWLFGGLLFIVALPLALMAKPNELALTERGDARKCPHCAELIKCEANVCRFCGRDVVPVAVLNNRNPIGESVICPRCAGPVVDGQQRWHACR